MGGTALRLKVCCIASIDEASAAIDAGALAVGLVGEMPNGPGPISDNEIRDIARHVNKRHGDAVWTTLLTSRRGGAAIADHITYAGVNTVQIVDDPELGAYAVIRKAHPRVRIMQVIHVENESAIDAARRAAAHVDVILLDSGKPSARMRTLGGTGDAHDWSISRQIVNAVSKPVFLAGGLKPENVMAAIEMVRPFGVDVCSGLRDKSRGYALNQAKLTAFAARLQRRAL